MIFLTIPEEKPIQVKHDYSNHLRTVSIGTDSPYFKEADPFVPKYLASCSSKKKFNKYFGKKVTKLACLYQNDPINLTRYFKALKTVSLFSSRIPTHLPKSIKNLYISNAPSIVQFKEGRDKHSSIENNMTSFISRRIENCKNLESLQLLLSEQVFSLRKLQTLIHLQSLTISSDRTDLLTYHWVFVKLTQLQELRISILNDRGKRSWKAEQQTRLSEIYRALLGLNNLEFLEIDLLKCPEREYSDALIHYIDDINNTKIPSFHIKLSCVTFKGLDFERLRISLRNIDLFTACFDQEKTLCFSCDTESNNTDQIPRKPKRQLELVTIPTFQSANTRQSLFGNSNRFSSDSQSQAFDVSEKLQKIFGDPLKQNSLFQKGAGIPKLKVFSFNLLLQPSSVYNRYIPEMTCLLENSDALEHLTIAGFGGYSLWMDTDKNYIHFFSEIAKLKSLTSLKLEGDITFELKPEACAAIQDMFWSVKNFRKLHIETKITKSPEFLICLLESGSLAELYIELLNIKFTSRERVIETIISMTELEKLGIKNGGQLFEGNKNRYKLMTGLQKMKKLIEVSIPFIERSLCALPPKSIDEDVGLVAREAEKYIKELFNVNKRLASFYLNLENKYEIKHTRY